MLIRVWGFYGTASAWSPLNLANLVAWHTSKVGVDNTGGAVTTWHDEDNDTPNLVTGTSPTLMTDGNGIPFVRFDGTNDTLNWGGATMNTLLGANNFSILCAVKIRSNVAVGTGTWEERGIVLDANELFGIHIPDGTSPFGVVAYCWDGAEKTTAAQQVTANVLAVIQVWHNGSSINIQLDQNSPATLAAGSITPGPGTLHVARTVEATDLFAAIDLYDLVLVDAAIDSTARQNYYNFVQSEYT